MNRHTRRAFRSPSGVTLADLVIAAALLALIFAGVVPAVGLRAREQANRNKCASSLRQIGLALVMYANDNKGNFPRTRYDQKTADKPAAYTGVEADSAFGKAGDEPAANDVTAALYLALKTQDITSELFICRSAGGRRLGGDVQAMSNFPNRRHLSYSYANPYPSKQAVHQGFKFNNTLSSDFALAADMNPGGEDVLTKLTPSSPADQMRKGNSPNHDGEGQNVLYADGHAEWQPTPFCGTPLPGAQGRGAAVVRDNIYTFGESGPNSGGEGVVGAPAGPWDSVLLPTYEQGKPPSTLPPNTKPLQPPARGEMAWTLDEAERRLALHPDDPYLQYVVLQLARREDRVDEYADLVAELTRRGDEDDGGGDTADVDLFGLFTGELAVHESLQLNTMRGEPVEPRDRGGAAAPAAPAPATTAPQNAQVNGPDDEPSGDAAAPGGPGGQSRDQGIDGQQQQPDRQDQTERQEREGARGRAGDAGQDGGGDSGGGDTVAVSSLTGPTVQSHPWEEMLAKQAEAGKRPPELSPLADSVPEDFYLAEFRSLSKLMEAAESGDLWATHLSVQAAQQARTPQVTERLTRQLALKTEALLRPFYDQAVERVAATGSDLFWREGSDVTFLFRLSQPALAKTRLDGFLDAAAKARPDAKREEGEYRGVPYVHVSTPDRVVSVFSAYPRPDLHVRGNSRAAFERVLGAIAGRDDGVGGGGEGAGRLGRSKEFAYVRTVMPPGAEEEDGFVYLSDPLIRHLVGPKLKLTERRRLICANHLRMIGHAALLYRSETGRDAKSLKELADAQCTPGMFGEGELACPDGGTYGLLLPATDEGVALGTCSVHGTTRFLTPCCEIELDRVSSREAEQYRAFVERYNQYWRTYFDPIALRLQITPHRYRVETLILPLIDNTIYTGLARALGGGEPEPLDALPVPRRNIFSVAARFNKAELLKQVGDTEEAAREWQEELGLTGEEAAARLDVRRFLEEGLGSQIGLHVYDAPQTFDLNVPELVGALIGMSGGGGDGGDIDAEVPLMAALVASLNSPVYLSAPVKDAKVVDEFLAGVDQAAAMLARQSGEEFFFEFRQDFYRLPGGPGGLDDNSQPGAGDADADAAQPIRCGAMKVGPVTWRFFWARIGDGLYVASKRFILEDLAAAKGGGQAEQAGGARAKAGADDRAARGGDGEDRDVGPAGHAMVRVRAQNWDQVLPDFRLAWAENGRRACLDNLGPLTSVHRAYAPVPDDAKPKNKPAKSKPRGAGPRKDRAAAGAEAVRRAGLHYDLHFFCPEGGKYLVSPGGKEVTCSVHGSALDPRQPTAPAAGGAGEVMETLDGMTATLTFTEDGLHGVVTVERQ